MDESSAAWLAAAIEGGAVFEDVLGMTDLELGDHDCVRAGEQAVYQAWVLEPVVLEAQLVVRESRQRLGHLYVGGEQR